MALYSYQALTKDGKKVTGTLDSNSVTGVREQLMKQSLYPVTISLAKEARQGWRLSDLFARSVSEKDKILFTKQLAILLKSGVPLLEAFELLIDQFTGKLRSILIDLKDDLREGKTLAQGLARFPKVFDNVYVQLVRAGEATGKLETVLERLVEYMERREEVRKRIKDAMTYPLIQLGIVSLVLVFLMTVVVPKLAATFKSQGKELPGTTQFIMGVSDFILAYYIYILIALAGLIAAFQYWKSTPSGARTIDQIKLKLPLIKYFTQTGAVVQFSRTLGILVESGVNWAESLDIVVNVIDNRVLADSLREARDNIIKQGKIAQFLKQTNIFPPIAIHLIKTGEETGKLDTMLLTVAQNYETELNELADGLSAALQPIMLVVMAVIVGFIVISIAQPLMEQASLAAF